MSLLDPPNALVNSNLSQLPYGPGPFTEHDDFVAAHILREGTGVASRVTVAPGTSPTNSSLVPWKRMRGVSCLDVTVTADFDPDDGDTFELVQYVEKGSLFGETRHRLLTFVFGPNGASFETGIAGTPVTGVGHFLRHFTTSPTFPMPCVLDELCQEAGSYQKITLLRAPRPATPGTAALFQVVHIQLDYLGNDDPPTPPQYRDVTKEFELCSRYAWAIPQHTLCHGIAGNAVAVPVVTPVPMYEVPDLRLVADSISVVKTTDGVIYTSSDPSPGFGARAAPDGSQIKSDRGGKVVLQNFTAGLGSAQPAQIDTPNAVVLHAEIGLA